METVFSRQGLNWLNFFLAAAQTGFGPFISVYLTQQGWSQADVGFALSLGTGAALLFQLPSGVLVDAFHTKRRITAIALVMLGVSAALLAAAPQWETIWTAQVLHALASCILTPAVAAITLSLCGHAAYGERLGLNARYASIGNALAAGGLGACAFYFNERSVFAVTAMLVLPALLALFTIRATDRVGEQDHSSLLLPKQRRRDEGPAWCIFRDPTLHIFAVCIVLFHLSNAAMLPLALNELAKRTGAAGFAVSASIVVPQIVVALASPFTGRAAQRWGRRPVLLIGFAALPLRALAFATLPGAVPLVMLQTLDGISAAVFGIMLPLVAADETERTGYLNLAIASLGLAAGLGATFSTTIAGLMADAFGAPVAFLGLAVAGVAALFLVWQMMPETRPMHHRSGWRPTGRRVTA
jgi:MFS family permease